MLAFPREAETTEFPRAEAKRESLVVPVEPAVAVARLAGPVESPVVPVAVATGLRAAQVG